MAKPPIPSVPSISKEYNRIFPSEWLRRECRSSGAMRRYRLVDIVPFFWTLVLAPTAVRHLTLAALQRCFQVMAGFELAPSAFQKRFSNGLVRFLRDCAARVFAYQLPQLGVSKVFQQFIDVLIVDSTLVSVANSLAKIFPGPRTNTSPAAVKVNTVYSVLSGSVKKLQIAPGVRAERKLLRVGRELAGHLLLFDLGYFAYTVFERIDHYHGFFISRLKRNANPVIVSERRQGRGRHRSLVGQKVWDAIRGLKRDLVDVDVEVNVRRRLRRDHRSGRKTETKRCRFRVVGIRNHDTGKLHLYLTNVSATVMTPNEVATSYASRWLVELLYRELKHCYGMHSFPSARPEVVKALIYAALIRVALSRAALAVLRQRCIDSSGVKDPRLLGSIEFLVKRRMPAQRFAAVFSFFSLLMLPDVLTKASVLDGPIDLEYFMLKFTFDPNMNPTRLRKAMEAA